MPTEVAPDAHAEPEFVCACEAWARSTCAREGFFREHEGRSYCVLHYPSQDKTAAFNSALQNKLEAKDFDFRGVWFPDPVAFGGFQFTRANFTRAIFSKPANFSQANFIESADFSEVTFYETVIFSGATFGAGAIFSWAKFGALTRFDWATFCGAASFDNTTFSPVTFSKAIFYEGAIFTRATFSEAAIFDSTFKQHANFGDASFNAAANFIGASFNASAFFDRARFNDEARFTEARFDADATFNLATFSSSANFRNAIFIAAADFTSVIFASYVRFVGNEDHPVFGDRSYLDLQHARMERPERVSFHTLTLRSHWFVNVDARKFEFVNVKLKPEILQDIKSLTEHLISAPHRLLDIAYRRLAVNAEENHHYYDAADFRYAAMDVRRQEEWRGMAVWRLAWWYWLLSGYGERITRAAGCLLLILVLFAGLYTQVGFVPSADQTTKPATTITTPDTVGTPLHFNQALVHSFEVSILQKPEPKPLTLTARFLVGLETVLGPLQAALLALAIRRKFMR
ncbi:MAG: pentapeptide repeat-containing protein [Acidobacteriota bacterium]